jgi:hypothetical protein
MVGTEDSSQLIDPSAEAKLQNIAKLNLSLLLLLLLDHSYIDLSPWP